MAPDYQTIELDPEAKTTLKMYLFKNVPNVEFIRDKIIQGEWKCAVIKPRLIVDSFQVAVAANKAVLADKLKTLVTKSVFTEILYNLSLSKNISQSLNKFGIQKDMHMLFCFLITDGQDASTAIIPKIEGEMCPMQDLYKFTSKIEVKQMYKLNNLKNDASLLDLVVSRMATKSFVSHSN